MIMCPSRKKQIENFKTHFADANNKGFTLCGLEIEPKESDRMHCNRKNWMPKKVVIMFSEVSCKSCLGKINRANKIK